MLASHIKPWRDSDPRERLDHRERLLLPEGADPPGAAYLRWHRARVFAA